MIARAALSTRWPLVPDWWAELTSWEESSEMTSTAWFYLIQRDNILTITLNNCW